MAGARRDCRTAPVVASTLKRSQRERLIDAMVTLSTQRGYHKVSIAELCSQAGVSTETFYAQFDSKEECFLEAYVACRKRVFAQLWALAAQSGDCSQAARLALEELLKDLARDPDAARLLFVEALGGGPLIRAERERTLAQFERAIEQLLRRTPEAGKSLDVPPTAVIGALRHIVSGHLRAHREDRLPVRLEDGLAWLCSYEVPAGSTPWSTSPAALLEGAPVTSRRAAWEPDTLPPGRHGLPAGVIARSQRTRLIFATAEVTMAKGYQNAKISDIATAARVTKAVFYEHFASKEEAFLEAQRRATQYILDTCTWAYFSVDRWPQRLWRALQRLLGLICENPAISHLRLVECYAAGPVAIQRAEEITRSFTIFLEEGYYYPTRAPAPPRLASQAVVGAISEIVQRQVERREFATLGAHLPQLAYVAIAPFTGAQEAIELVERMKARELVA